MDLLITRGNYFRYIIITHPGKRTAPGVTYISYKTKDYRATLRILGATLAEDRCSSDMPAGRLILIVGEVTAWAERRRPSTLYTRRIDPTASGLTLSVEVMES